MAEWPAGSRARSRQGTVAKGQAGCCWSRGAAKMDKAKAAANIAKAKVEEALKKPPRQWETGICGCFDDFGGGKE